MEAIALVTFSALWMGAFAALGFEAFGFGPGRA